MITFIWKNDIYQGQNYRKNNEERMCVHSKLLQCCVTLCNPMDCSPPGSSVHGIFQARILEWVPCPPLGHLPYSGIKPKSLRSPELTGRFFSTSTTWEARERLLYQISNIYLIATGITIVQVLLKG